MSRSPRSVCVRLILDLISQCCQHHEPAAGANFTSCSRFGRYASHTKQATRRQHFGQIGKIACISLRLACDYVEVELSEHVHPHDFPRSLRKFEGNRRRQQVSPQLYFTESPKDPGGDPDGKLSLAGSQGWFHAPSCPRILHAQPWTSYKFSQAVLLAVWLASRAARACRSHQAIVLPMQLLPMVL